MEDMVTEAFWRGRRVLLTGHTGFKGSWLALWLTRMGAHVTGFSLPAESPSLFEQARIGELVDHIEGDVRDPAAVDAATMRANPEIVFHLAAQPLVRLSYDKPAETFATNVQGTVHVLDACRRVANLKAVVCITSDKCYENREWIWPYRENDPMGGHDPYSASKGAAELVISAYRRSFFQNGAGIASVRAGNVIGGGDWAADRLIPDIIRALIAGEKPLIRSPHSIRPWQHVFEALGGYLMIAEKLWVGHEWTATGWNFGPADDDTRSVSWIADRICATWGADGWIDGAEGTGAQPHEAKILKLDCAKARSELGWRPTYTLSTAIRCIVEWHKNVAHGAEPRAISLQQLEDYRQEFKRALSQKGVA